MRQEESSIEPSNGEDKEKNQRMNQRQQLNQPSTITTNPNRSSNRSLRLVRSLPEDGRPNTDLITPERDSALVIFTHAHAQLQLLGRAQAKLLGNLLPRLLETDEVLILILRGGSLGSGDGADGHQAHQLQVGTLLHDKPTQVSGLIGLEAGLVLLARCVDLDVDPELLIAVFLEAEIPRSALAPALVEEAGLLFGIDALDGPETTDVTGEGHAFVGLQGADEVPADAWWEDAGFLEEFLDVVLAEVEVGVGEMGDGGSIEGDDVGDGFEFGDCDDADGFVAV